MNIAIEDRFILSGASLHSADSGLLIMKRKGAEITGIHHIIIVLTIAKTF